MDHHQLIQKEVTAGRVSTDTDEIDLRRYAYVILKRKWFIFLFAALVAVIAMLWTMGTQRIYSASCAIVIEAQAPQVLGEIRDAVNIGSGGYWYNREYYETQYRIIKSREVAERVIQRLGLQGDLSFLGIDKLPVEKREQALERADPAAILLSRLFVEPVRDSMVVQIRFEDTSRERAAAVSNAVASTYMELNAERRVEGSRDAADWLNDQQRDLKARHEKSELALFEFRRENDLVYTSLEDKQTMTTQKYATISDSLTKARIRRAELGSKVRKIQDARKSGSLDGLLSLDDVSENGFIIELKRKQMECANEVLDLSERYGDEHPKMKVAREKLESATKTLRRELELLLNGQLTKYAELQETERTLTAMLADVKNEAFENNKKEIEYKRLAREEANDRTVYDLVLKRMTELDLSSLLKTNNVRILEQASVPDRPLRPKPIRNILVALALGFLCGMGIALVLDALDQSVRGPDDLTAMAVDCLGLLSKIPAGKNKDRDRFVADSPQSILSEQMRAIRTNMLFMRPDSPPKLIVITSAFPQEGKTTTLINLGIILAQTGGKILLVDTDMRRPRLHKSFGMDKCAVGLSSAIAGTSTLEESVRETDIENLYVLPCGPIPPNPAELLHTKKFRDLVAEMGTKFDRVLFDSPPAGVVTDAIILAKELDGAVFVVKAFKTAKPAVERTLESIREVGGDKILGAILNNVSAAKGSGYYGGYYGGYHGGYYRYGSYGESRGSKQKSRSPGRQGDGSERGKHLLKTSQTGEGGSPASAAAAASDQKSESAPGKTDSSKEEKKALS